MNIVDFDNQNTNQNQSRNRSGQFSTGKGGQREKLEGFKKFRVEGSLARESRALFEHHHKDFGWQLGTDADRDIFAAGVKVLSDRLKNPDREMLALRRRAEMIERAVKQARRHTDFEEEISKIERCIEVAKRVHDLYSLHQILKDYQELTELEDDRAIKERRELVFTNRFQTIWDEVNRPVSMDPDKFTAEDDK